jgi:hypothetical protein
MMCARGAVRRAWRGAWSGGGAPCMQSHHEHVVRKLHGWFRVVVRVVGSVVEGRCSE